MTEIIRDEDNAHETSVRPVEIRSKRSNSLVVLFQKDLVYRRPHGKIFLRPEHLNRREITLGSDLMGGTEYNANAWHMDRQQRAWRIRTKRRLQLSSDDRKYPAKKKAYLKKAGSLGGK